MGTLYEKNFMFLGHTVFERNAMITCIFLQYCATEENEFFLYINPYGYFMQKDFMFLCRTVFKKNAIITCNIQSCTIVHINFEIFQDIIAFFSDTVVLRNIKFTL